LLGLFFDHEDGGDMFLLLGVIYQKTEFFFPFVFVIRDAVLRNEYINN
jgi:hypothetical protein